MARILLIKPPSHPGVTGVKTIIRSEKKYMLNEPLELELIAATVPDEEVKIFDMRLEGEKLDIIGDFKPDVVGITAYTTSVYISKRIAKNIKDIDPKIKIIFGGHHAMLLPEDFNEPFIDVVVYGHGEKIFPELIEAYKNNKMINDIRGIGFRLNDEFILNPPNNLENLDNYPLPDRSLTKKYFSKYHLLGKKNYFIMEMSRGCPHRCIYCSVWKANAGLSYSRSPQSVINEIKTIKSKNIFFIDPNPTHNVKMVWDFLRLLKSEKIKKKYTIESRADVIVSNPDLFKEWAELGLEFVLVGFESIKNQNLFKYNKKCDLSENEKALNILKECGIVCIAQFVIDQEFEKDDFLELNAFIKKNDIVFPVFTTLTPLPGSDLFENKKNELISDNYEMFDFFYSLLPTKLPLKKFYKEMMELYENRYRLRTQIGYWIKSKIRGNKNSFNLSKIYALSRILSEWKIPENKRVKK